jgi:hypothetical protein
LKIFLVGFTFWITLPGLVIAQLDSTDIISEDLIENILEDSDEESDNSELIDVLDDLKQNPVDINSADLIELLKLPDIDQKTAQIIIDHRNKYGPFYSTNELYSIKNINKQIIKNILPFITINNKSQDNNSNNEQSGLANNFFNQSRIFLRSRLTNDIQDREGFLSDKYQGSKLKSYNRFIYQYGSNYRAGLLTEKDPGEKSFTDFTSFHFQIKNIAFLNNFIAGDYVLEYGQGLALWSAFGFSKGADAIYPVKKKARFLRSYTSSAEYRFFRGVATQIQIHDFNITGFYSFNSLDATVDPITNEITSFGQTGYHRFESEIIKKNAAKSKVIGGVLDYRYKGRFNLGVIYYNTTFNKYIESKSIYDLSGDNFNYLSTYYDLNFDKINLFGEFCYDGLSVASVNGFQISASHDFIFITSIRSYPRNYRNLYGFGFSERSGKINNEVGIYSGLKWRLPFGIIDLYFDNFKFPYKTSENSLSSEGNEFLFNFISRPLNKLETLIRYKYENKEVTELIENNENIARRLKQLIRTEIIYYVSNNIRLKTRFEYNDFLIKDAGLKEKGVLMLQDIRFIPFTNLNFYGRIIFFQTDSFNSAIYEYENDLLGVMPNLAMYGKGIRMYIILRYEIQNHFAVSAKYSETYKPNEITLGSGDNEILGNVDNRISLQVDINL